MTTSADYSEAEWTRLKRAPFLAGMAISLADPGGPIEAVKETAAALKAVVAAADGGGHGELVTSIAQAVREDARNRNSPMSGFKPTGGANAGIEILDELRELDRIAAAKATPEEIQDFRDWIVAVAQEAADAAKEGGFMGFHAVRVSEGEQRMLDQLRGALTASSG